MAISIKTVRELKSVLDIMPDDMKVYLPALKMKVLAPENHYDIPRSITETVLSFWKSDDLKATDLDVLNVPELNLEEIKSALERCQELIVVENKKQLSKKIEAAKLDIAAKQSSIFALEEQVKLDEENLVKMLQQDI